jgi:hypothetical protein
VGAAWPEVACGLLAARAGGTPAAAPAATALRRPWRQKKGRRGGRQMTVKVVAHSVGSEKARRWRNNSGAGASPLGNGGHGRSSAQSDRRSEKRQRE